MSNYKLSIIIPYYNCTSTLEEALASVYTQNLTILFSTAVRQKIIEYDIFKNSSMDALTGMMRGLF